MVEAVAEVTLGGAVHVLVQVIAAIPAESAFGAALCGGANDALDLPLQGIFRHGFDLRGRGRAFSVRSGSLVPGPATDGQSEDGQGDYGAPCHG
jgi:hypothetical protein